MRKILVGLVIIALTVSAGVYYYVYQPFNGQTAIEAVLPGDTFGLVRVCELKKQIERFRTGRMGQAMGRIDLPQLMAIMEVPSEQRMEISQALENFKAAIDGPWFDTLFGQDVSLALLNGNIDARQLESGDLQTLLDAVVVVARPEQPIRILESLNSMFGSRLSVQTQNHQQWEVNRFDLENGQAVYYALTDGLMIAGLSMTPVKRCLEQSLDAASSLLQAQAYRRHCADLYKRGRTDLIAFVNAGRVLAHLREAVSHKGQNDPDMNLLLAQLESIQGIETINLVQYDDGSPLVHSKMIVGIDRLNMSPRLTRAIAIDPATNPTLKHVPVDTLLYHWQNTLDLKLYWQEIQQHPEMTPETVAQIKQSFAMKTGMEIESLLEALGTQAGLLVKDINMDGIFPFPELALFIEVRQPNVIDQLIKQQISQFNMPLQHETYRESNVQYVMLPAGENLSPAYTFLEGFCTLAINRTLLKSILNAPETNHLGTHSSFKTLGRQMTADNNQIFYLHSEGLTARIRDLISWGMGMQAMTQSDEIEKSKKIMALGINPLLDGLSMIKAVGGRTYTDENIISSDIRVLLDRS